MCVKDWVPAMAFEKSSKKMVYTFKEVAEHNSPGDLWIVIYGKVYDVSNFVTEVRMSFSTLENLSLALFV